ncbi:hypothetical protein ACH4F6_37835 [Streptomyces sp. NPDC017936]|uniref:hypothetical protein n=1 Tax=Streptomyces sp. NPDC017936 TaxID=3365016 RepID=UPI0037A6C128
MAIAFRSAGARTKADVTLSGSPVSVALPAGHVSGDVLLLFVLTDANTNVTFEPAGWTRLFYITAGSSVSTPYTARPRLKVFYRVDTGSLGSSVNLEFSTASWPAGDPYVLAFTAAYSGADTTGPVETWAWRTDAGSTAAQAHPQLTTTTAGDWLVTYRAVSADSPSPTFTSSVGTDAERVDDSDGFGELAAALYDSSAALAAGAQTVRTTTASRAALYGSLMVSIALKPSAAAGAATPSPSDASVVAVAPSPTVAAQNGPWDLCGEGLPHYSVAVDWEGDGTFTGTGDDVTGDITGDMTVTYGRDQARQLSPAAIGSAAFSVVNANRDYSPENTTSPLYGDLGPARRARAVVEWGGRTYPLFWGRIDDFTVKADRSDRSADFTLLDETSLLQGAKVTAGVQQSMRTGALVHLVLDLAGWTGPRDIDPGATVVRYWWADNTEALAAIKDLVLSEGPPAVAYQAPDGTFVFRDRHHRLLRARSLESQGTFSAGALDCAAPAVTGGYSYTPPFTYAHGWRDVINVATFDVEERVLSAVLETVWSSQDTYNLSIGESLPLTVSGSDPFLNAITPVAGTDYQVTGPGTVRVTLSRTSGASTTITLAAVGGSVTVSALQLRARPLVVERTVHVSRRDAASAAVHGERNYPESAPWAGASDAAAIAAMVLLQYAQRRPTVDLRVVTQDPAHFLQVLQRTVSDRIRIRNDETGLDDDFYVERISHTVRRRNAPGRPPVHAVVLGCEKDLTEAANPFRFDVRGAGFDQGTWDPVVADNVDSVFVFDDPVRGRFDAGAFGT